MTMFTARSGLGSYFEGHRLLGEPSNIGQVIDWIVLYGLPRLIDPTQKDEVWSPEKMVDSRGMRHTPGVYIHPKKGVLIIRNRYKQTLQGDYGDWVFRDTVNNNFFVVKQLSIDNGTYIKLAE